MADGGTTDSVLGLFLQRYWMMLRATRKIRTPRSVVVPVLLGSLLLPPGVWGSTGPWISVGSWGAVKEDKSCVHCHAASGMILEMESGEELSLFIDASVYSGSPHSALGCRSCHGYHAVESKVDFEWLSGNSCRRCHEDVFAAYAASAHGQEHTIGHLETPACPDCHRSHDVTLASLDKPLMEACLGCH